MPDNIIAVQQIILLVS